MVFERLCRDSEKWCDLKYSSRMESLGSLESGFWWVSIVILSENILSDGW